MPSDLDYGALSDAITRGVVAGTSAVVDRLTSVVDKRHDLRDVVQNNVDKVYELDREVILLKGMMTALVGSGDGSTGMVPRMEKDMSSLGKEMTAVKGEVQDLRGDVAGVKEAVASVKTDVKAIREAQGSTTSWVDGWKAIGVFIAIIGTCVTIMVGVITVVMYILHGGGIK